MPDYNLGRAYGEIKITADTSGAQEAQASMAATEAEAEVLNRRMGEVNRQFEVNRQRNVESADSITRHRQQAEQLRLTYQRYFDEYERAQRRYQDSQSRLSEALDREGTDRKELDRLMRDANRAKQEEERLLGRVNEAHARYAGRLALVSSEVRRFNEAHIAATTGLNQMRIGAERASSAIEKLSGAMGSLLRMAGTGGLVGIFGLGSAGTTAAAGAGGLGQIASIASGVVLAVQQLSGVVALLPAVAGGAAISLGTLATAFQGVGAAMGSIMDADPTKFIQAVRDLAPAAREAMLVMYSFQDAIRGVRFAIQQATFAPFVQQLQPLIYTWLPLLQNAGVQVGRTFGQMASTVMSFFQQAGTQQAFGTFVQNMVTGLQAASQAIRPLLNAFQTLSVVGSTFFGRIGDAITHVANEFNNWVQTAAASGRLQSWISSALDGFTALGHIVLNVGEAVMNIASIGSRYGGGFLQWVQELSQRFLQWTESARGLSTITNFFDLLQQAGHAISPILHLIGEGLATVLGAFTRLGINIAPGVTQFFQSIVQALHFLAPILQQMGPSLSAFFVALGNALVQVVQGAGPQLPAIFQGLAAALTSLVQILPVVIPFIAEILAHLTPTEIEVILGVAVAVRTLGGAFSLVAGILSAGPWGIAAAAIVAIGVAAFEAYQHWGPFHDAIQTVWEALQNFAGWMANLPEIIGNALQPIDRFVQQATEWGSHLVENFANGISSGIHWVIDAVNNMIDQARGHLPGSRAKYGPFATASPEEIGTQTAQGYAAGLSSGTPAVAAASSGIAGSAAGIGTGGGTGGLGFSSAGTAGHSGTGLQGNSGFDRYVKFLTTDLTAWNNILSGAFKLAQDTINNVIVPTIRVAANLWGGGDNPLTRPGGFFGPQRAWGQQNVPGIENVEPPGQAPDDYGRKLGARAQAGGQQQVPGVQNVGPQTPGGGRARVYGPGTPGSPGGPPAPAPSPPPGGAPPAAGPAPTAPAGRSQQDLTNYIIGKATSMGFTRDEANAFVAQAFGESNIGQNNVGTTTGDASGGAAGVFQFTPGTARGIGLQDPMDPIQNIDAYFRLFQQRDPGGADIRHRLAVTSGGGPAVPGNIGLTWQQAQAGAQPFVNAYQQPGQPGGVFPQGGLERFGQQLQQRRDALAHPQAPTQRGQPYGLPRGTDTGGYGNPAADQIFPPWVLELGKQFHVRPSTYATHQESDRGGERGYAPNPQGQNRGIDWVGSREDMQAFAQALLQYGGAEGSGGALEQVIYQAGPGGQRYGLGGAGNINEGYYPQHGEGSYDEHGGLDTGAHVHTRFSASVPPTLAQAPPAGAAPDGGGAGFTPATVLPPGPRDTLSGLRLPGWASGIGAAATGLGAAAGLPIAGLAARGAWRAGSNLRGTRGLQALLQGGADPGDVATLQQLMQEGRPGAADALDLYRQITATPANPYAALQRNLAGIDLAPGASDIAPSPFSQLSPADQAQVARDLQAFRGTGLRGGIAGEGVLGPSPVNPPASVAGADAASVAGDAGAAIRSPLLGRAAGIGGFLGRVGGTLALTGPGSSSDVRRVDAQGNILDAQGRPTTTRQETLNELRGIGRGLASGATITGQESTQTPGVIYGPNGQVLSAGPRRTGTSGTPPANPPASTQGRPPANTALPPGSVQIAPGVTVSGGGPAGPVQINRAAPGFGGLGGRADIQAGIGRGAQSEPVKVDVTHQGGVPVGPPSPTQANVALRDQPTPTTPQPGQPGVQGPVRVQRPAQQNPPAAVQGQNPPNAQNVPGQDRPGGIDYKNVYDPANMPQKLPYDAKTPAEAFTKGMADVGNIAGDAFQVFGDIIDNISKTADILDTLARGPANTEDVIKMIQDFQSYLKTASDVFKMIGDIGGAAGGASGGADMGGGAALQAIAGIISSAISAVNEGITLAIDTYHEIGKYAGFIFGEFLGGAATGPLGGNVRMLLNTRTNQLQTYSEDNPLNKNTFNVPVWQRSYQQQPTPPATPAQINYYAGPGDSPQQFMSNAMYMSTVAAGPVASVSGRD